MQYICALRRAWRKEHGETDAWLAELAETPGVKLLGDPTFGRQMIEADSATIDALTEKYGEMLHFEPIIEYRKLDD